MSYNSYEQFSGKLVIYQHGLGDGPNRFSETISKLVAKKPSKNAKYTSDKYSESHIDMSSYDGENNCYKDDASKTKIINRINDLREFCDKNPNKNVHVATRLNGNEPIEYQKNRLVELIKYLKNTLGLSRDIVLVGHSQGGLVNLETAIEIPTYISQIISINTPYSANSIAIKATCLINFCNMISVDAAEYYLSIGEKDAKKMDEEEKAELAKKADGFESCVKALADSDYLEGLKSRWSNLTNRPKLHVITSASALDVTNLGLTKRPFDCLVNLNAQKDIAYDTVQYLVPLSVPCIQGQSGWFANNFREDNCGICTYDCIWPKVRLNRMLCSVLEDLADPYVSVIAESNWSELWRKIKTFDIASLDFGSIQLMKTVIAAKDGDPLPGDVTDEDCVNFYNAIVSPYSHMNSTKLDSCIYCIRSYIE